MHDPILINICVSDIPKTHYWKTKDGKVMLTARVCERQTPSEKGNTHYAQIYDREAQEKAYVGYGKFDPYKPQEIDDSDLPPGAESFDEAEVVSEESQDMGF